MDQLLEFNRSAISVIEGGELNTHCADQMYTLYTQVGTEHMHIHLHTHTGTQIGSLKLDDETTVTGLGRAPAVLVVSGCRT